MSRRISRELALQSLFQIDFDEYLLEEDALNAAVEAREETAAPEVKDYALKLVLGVMKHKDAIDSAFAKYSKDWDLARMPIVDKNILRIAVFEMRYAEKTMNPAIAINEAVELAKLYGADESSRFINGVLGKLAKE